MSVQGARIGQKKLYCKKVPENFQIRVDKTNCVWYSVLATRLGKSNHVAPEKRKPLQGLLRKPDPPWQSCGAVSGDPQVCRGEATPSCLRKTALWLKSPTGAFIAAQTRAFQSPFFTSKNATKRKIPRSFHETTRDFLGGVGGI